MAKVTTKLQVTVPKSIADRYGIRPGDEIAWVPAGDAIRVVPARALAQRHDVEMRLRLFDAATERQRTRDADATPARGRERRWARPNSPRGRAR